MEAKPCPFCGDKIDASDDDYFCTNAVDKWGRIRCGCGACGPEVRTWYMKLEKWHDNAIEAWNRRV